VDFSLFNLNFPSFQQQWPIVWRKGNVFLAMVSALSFMIICLAINMATILVMKRKTRNVAKMNPDRTRTEHRMTVYALVTFLGQFIMALYMVIG
jgi:sorbitol-specific phosphotransferase system component IIC